MSAIEYLSDVSDAQLLEQFNSLSEDEREAIQQVRWVQSTRQWIAKYPVINLDNVRQAFIEYV